MTSNGITSTHAQTHAASSSASKASKSPKNAASYSDMLSRIGNIPDLEQYEGAIERMLSGESEMEEPGSGKPLTEDQILMRKLKREYQKTNPLTFSQQKAAIQSERTRFIEYWRTVGSGPPPGYAIREDGSFAIVHSKEEKYEYQKAYNESFIRKVLSVIEERKAASAGNAKGTGTQAGTETSKAKACVGKLGKEFDICV